ncbi:MFS phospholipid transporter-like protein [Teratosphaeria nubilosa]|uniref:MFS phospholipid transporter-like protein n=1 Tax=Teratosphaeria nubilosa TaxID=161662 RepID=A0A6G1L881_9PEZI|nr:MFS phospholipid transporter-like protein [Teratosphaeria nubilosa]
MAALNTCPHDQDEISKTPETTGAVITRLPSDGIDQLTDPESPTVQVPTHKQRLSDIFTIICASFALISHGYQNNLMTMTNVVLKKEYKKQYTSKYSTGVSNALLVGEIIGQITIGLTCDYIGRKAAIIITTLMIVTIIGMFWMLTVARGIVGFGTDGEYPACSTSASEAANEHRLKQRGPIFIMVTNLPLSLGGPVAVIIFLIVLSAAGSKHLSTVWRTCMGIGVIFPLSVFYLRMKMLNSKLYRRGAIKRRVPYPLVIKYYWRSLIGTCGAWFLYDFVTFPIGIFSGEIISSVVTESDTIRSTGEWQLLLGILSIPGVLFGAYLCNKIGRKYTMMLGDMLGLLSSESYATAVRGTCYGISAAFGKTGAVIGTQAFTPIQTHLGKRWTFIIAAICGVAGILVTYFFVPNVAGEDLAQSDEKFRLYLVSKGGDGEMGEEDLKALAGEGIPEDVVEEVKAGK